MFNLPLAYCMVLALMCVLLFLTFTHHCSAFNILCLKCPPSSEFLTSFPQLLAFPFLEIFHCDALMLKSQFLSQLFLPPSLPLAATLKFPVLLCCCLFCCIVYILFSVFIICANDLALLSTSAAHSRSHVLYTVILNSFNFSII